MNAKKSSSLRKPGTALAICLHAMSREPPATSEKATPPATSPPEWSIQRSAKLAEYDGIRLARRLGDTDLDFGFTQRRSFVDFGMDDWPWWRGGRFDNSSIGKAVTEWSETKNIVWKSPVPGTGHASPILFGDRIFIATADENQKTQSLVC